MAKKQGISYGPNTALIKGARDVAQSESMVSMAGGAAFAQGFTGAVITGIQEQEKRNSIRDAYMADLKNIDNIYKLDQDYNKKAVNDFVFAKRDAYAAAADCYARTKDQGCRDKMEEIKFSFSNLNTQLDVLMNERKEYLNAYDKGQLVDIPELGDDKYTLMYTNKGQFNIEANGDVGFAVDGEYSKLKDVAGKWNVKNNIGETFTLEQNLGAKKIGESGKAFYRDDMKNLYTAKFKETGPEGIMVMAKTDLTGDNEYILSNGQKAGNLSFESMWSQGLLDEKFYKQIPKGTDSKWMYDKKNVNTLNGLMSEYYTDVTESSYNQGKKNYKGKGGSGKTGTQGHPSGIEKSVQLTNKQYMQVGTARTIKSNLETGTPFKWDGVDYKYEDGKWQTPEGIVGDGTADDIVYNMTNDPAFQNITTEKKTFVNSEGEKIDSSQEEFANENASSIPGLQGVINIDTLDQDDSLFAADLNKAMPTPGTNSNPKGYKWETMKSTVFGIKTPMGDFTKDAIELVDISGNTVVYPDGHEFAGQKVRIRTQGDKLNAIGYIDNVLETFGLSENMKNTSASPTGGGGKLLD